MFVEELTLENIRCFDKATLRFKDKKWITFLSQNGCGKSTVLQSLALLLAGPEGAQKLAPRPIGWLRDEDQPGKLSIKIHQSGNDPGQFGSKTVTRAFGYTFYLTGGKRLTIRNKVHTEPGVHESPEKRLTWLRQNAFASKGTGWFAVGYGAFRRLTRKSEIIVPSLEPQARYTNFFTQFDEDQPLSAFERWMVYLDYRIVKSNDSEAKRQKELGIAAINRLLPEGVRFDSVTAEGRIFFDVAGSKVPTLALSDGYRSVLALAGDLVWRLIQAFPTSGDPLKEEGIVLIDELDIHLHPIWQRDIALWLREQFPKLQFIVATHSPLIAAGAGPEALTLKFSLTDGKAVVEKVPDISPMNVDRMLQSAAFGIVSPYSPQTQSKIDRYDELLPKVKKLTGKEQSEFKQLSLFMKDARPIGGPPEPDSIQAKVEAYLEKKLQ
ncbi:MAG: AAA family ATPase [Deltaproteobacteria bacterium]|nr:AAA family ATPase [Deltaproteobacteria bacterium]